MVHSSTIIISVRRAGMRLLRKSCTEAPPNQRKVSRPFLHFRKPKRRECTLPSISKMQTPPQPRQSGNCFLMPRLSFVGSCWASPHPHPHPHPPTRPHTHTHRTHAFTHVCMHAHTYTCTRTHAARAHIQHACTHTCAHTHTRAHTQ